MAQARSAPRAIGTCIHRQPSCAHIQPAQKPSASATEPPQGLYTIKGIFKITNKGLMKFGSCRHQPYASDTHGAAGAVAAQLQVPARLINQQKKASFKTKLLFYLFADSSRAIPSSTT